MRNPDILDDDVQLMLDFQAGDPASFEILLKRYFPRILNFIYRYVGSRESAEDLTQEVFLRVYKSAARYIPRAKFKTWLYTIARNISANELRRNRHQALSLNEGIDGEEGLIGRQVEDTRASRPGEDLVRDETARAVKRAIDGLPERQRTAVILYRYENFSYQEIAGAMRISEKAVKSLLSRGREGLRSALSGIIKDEK